MTGATRVPTFFLVLLFGMECIASDRGPTPTEVDIRSDDALMSAVQTEMLIGAWFSDKGAGPMTISKRYISWSGCKTTYSITQKSVGKTFPDKLASFEMGSSTIKVGRYITVKLKIAQNKCIGDNTLGFLQLSFVTADANYSYASVVQYNVQNRPIAWYDLQKH